MSGEATGRPAEPGDEVAAAHRSLVAAGVLSHSGHGNLSARLDGDRMVLAAAGRLGREGAGALATVGFDGRVEQGALDRGTAEIVGMHAAVYRARPTAAAVVHTHSPAVTAFALAHRPLPCRYEALLRLGQVGPVPVVPWAPRGSPASVDGITRALADQPGTGAVLLANHGLVAFAADPATAVRLVVALEEAAGAEVAAAALGGARDFPPGAGDDVASYMSRAARGPGRA